MAALRELGFLEIEPPRSAGSEYGPFRLTEAGRAAVADTARAAWRRKVSLATLSAVVAIATGVATLQKDLFGGDDNHSRPVVVQANPAKIPSYVGSTGHFGASRPLLDFLRRHDAEVVRLKVAVDSETFDEASKPRWVVLVELCREPVGSRHEPDVVLDGCGGVELGLTGPTTADSSMYYSGGFRIGGYFAVDVDYQLHQGFTIIGLKPLTFERARAAVS
jgi:hypothetical protein